MFFFLLFFSGVTGSAAGRGQPPPTGINIAIDGYKSCDYRRAAPRRSARQTDYRRTMLPRLLLRTKQLVANTNDKRETTSVYTAYYTPRTRSFTVKLNVLCAFTLCCKCCSVHCETETHAHFIIMSILIFFMSCHFFSTRYTSCHMDFTLSYYHSHNIQTCVPLIRQWFYMQARMDKH